MPPKPMHLPTYFTDFLSAIAPTDGQLDDLRDGHTLLRERLAQWEPLKQARVTDFLQGSYRRGTALRPTNGKRSDVDIVVVTRLHESQYTPAQVIDVFKPFLEKYYKGKWRPQGRSFGITMSNVSMDLVPTSAPAEQEIDVLLSESVGRDDAMSLARGDGVGVILAKEAGAAWRAAPLRVPDRNAQRWEDTHPLAQIAWTSEKNASCNGHYVRVVKAIKWWKYDQHAEVPKPSSYPLERLIAECCPDGITSIAEGVVRTLETMNVSFRTGKPALADHGTGKDVLARITSDQFRAFHALLAPAAALARQAYEADDVQQSATLWRELFGSKFPEPPSGGGGGAKGGGFTKREGPSDPGSGRFA